MPGAFGRFERDASKNVFGPRDEFFGKLSTKCIEPLIDASRTTGRWLPQT